MDSKDMRLEPWRGMRVEETWGSNPITPVAIKQVSVEALRADADGLAKAMREMSEERPAYEGWTCWHCKEVVLIRSRVVRDGQMDSHWEDVGGHRHEHKRFNMECPVCLSHLINTTDYVKPFTFR